jgi:hypothetical protein
MKPKTKYPIFIPSKGRWENRLRLTPRYLERMGIPYHLIVEAQEYEQYAAVVNPEYGTVIVLDPAYQQGYDACMALEPGQTRGSGPARNFAWDLARAGGHARHWVIDDNIAGFYRLHQNRKVLALTDAFFRPMEDFVDRYENVVMAGPHYEHFALRWATHPPFILNSRIYSCNLIQTDAPFRWRGRWNEDTILSLDMLKAGYCTILFVALLQNKVATQRLEGGNTDVLYANGTYEKSKMLVREHPDVARLVKKWNRWHHHVNYKPFQRNRLVRNPDVAIPEGVNEYGMRLVKVERGQAVAS